MAPNVDINTTTGQSHQFQNSHPAKTTLPYASQGHDNLIRKPLSDSGSLDKYRHFEVTPVIGTEFPDVQLSDLLQDDTKIRDLAITGKRETTRFLRSYRSFFYCQISKTWLFFFFFFTYMYSLATWRGLLP